MATSLAFSHTTTPLSKSLLPSRTLLRNQRVLYRIPVSTTGLRNGALAAVGSLGQVDKTSVMSVKGGLKDERPIIVVDNYDSFTYNLCQYIGELGAYFEVYRNDELTVLEIKRKNPRGILISPGPALLLLEDISLVIEKYTFPNDALEITAWTEDGLIMAAHHKKYRHIQGVQIPSRKHH